MSTQADRKPLVIIGTSGSLDYLKDTTGDRRYWPVRVPAEAMRRPLSPEERAVVDKLVAMTLPSATPAQDDGACDGLHDEGAPPHYLCTRCFPDRRGDLATPQEDVEDDVDQDPDPEME